MKMPKLMRPEYLSSSWCQHAVSPWAHAQASVFSFENKKIISDVTSSFVVFLLRWTIHGMYTHVLWCRVA